MRICELFRDPGLHGIRNLRRDRRRCLVIEVDHAARAEPRSAIRRHSLTKRSMSDSTVCGPKLTRTTDVAISCAMPMADRTRLAFMLPDEQALPADTEIPARSSCTSWLELVTPGIA